LDPAQSGTAGLVFATYLGGLGYEDGYGIAVDDSNEVYLIGTTASPDFLMENPIQGTYGGGPYDAYVAKIESNGSALSYSTFLGGSGDDEGYGLSIDSSHNVYVTGFSSSIGFPVLNAFQPANSGGYEAFVTQINSAGSALTFSTYFGGFSTDAAYGNFYEPTSGNLYLTGQTYSSGSVPLVNPYQVNNAGGSDVLVARIDASPASADLSVVKTDAPDPLLAGQNLVYTVTIANSGPGAASDVRLFDTLPSQVSFLSAIPSQGSGCSTNPFVSYQVSCELGDVNIGGNISVTLTVNVPSWVSGVITNTASVMTNLSDPDAANNIANQATTVFPYGLYLPIILR
jgi:uncharacterized repeat protein (TIGR01451 family)